MLIHTISQYAAFGYVFAESHNDRQPSWQYYDNFVNYVSRMQFILQEGVPIVDLVFYMYSSRWELETQYQSDNLQALGESSQSRYYQLEVAEY